ncbi:MAG: hypothetical protein WBE39_15870 [Candidatus Competibacter sp.]
MKPERALFGFAAGFLATLIFHQLTLAALWALGLAPFAPFSLAPTSPLGVPAVVSLAFWGGVWGIVLAMIERRFPPRGGYWLAAFLFGALAPSLVAWFVVLPLKGRPLGGGWHPPLLVAALLINGAWGLGTAWFFKIFERFGSKRRAVP